MSRTLPKHSGKMSKQQLLDSARVLLGTSITNCSSSESKLRVASTAQVRTPLPPCARTKEKRRITAQRRGEIKGQSNTHHSSRLIGRPNNVNITTTKNEYVCTGQQSAVRCAIASTSIWQSSLRTRAKGEGIGAKQRRRHYCARTRTPRSQTSTPG